MNRIKKLLIFLIASILFLTFISISCAASSAAQLNNITVILDWVPNTNHTGLYVARDKGFYKDMGLEVEIIQPAEGGSAELIAANKGDFGISYQEQVTYARTADQPLPIVAVAAIIQQNTSGFASPAERNIDTPADFEGKRYGGWGSPMEEAMLKGLMDKYGADYSQLEMVNIGAADFFASVQRDIDFAWIYYGWDGIRAELMGFPLDFMLLQDLDPQLNFYTPVIIASKNTIEENPQLVENFLQATQEGYQFCIEQPDDAARILLKENPELDSDMIIASQQYLSTHYISHSQGWGYMKEEIWEGFSSWMYEKGLISKPLDFNQAYTNEFLPEP
ncbi:MAG: ABC transporter substrate-binding protein [Actinomycetota bacterium]|nr:ABC transporter substrate-binding protein [Actinomycetota bacterium]